MRKRPLGELESLVLQFVTSQGPCTVREVAEQFAEQDGLARTTILTVMERLRHKGYLVRTKTGGSFAYSAAHEKGEVMNALIKDFVEKTLGGSLSPFVAYLAKTKGLTDKEFKALNEIVTAMEKGDRDDS